MRQLSWWFMALLAGRAVTWALWAMLQPVLPDSSALTTLGGSMVALFALHQLAQWAEARGWIYYQKRHGSWGAVGAAMSEVHAIYRPGEPSYSIFLRAKRDRITASAVNSSAPAT